VSTTLTLEENKDLRSRVVDKKKRFRIRIYNFLNWDSNSDSDSHTVRILRLIFDPKIFKIGPRIAFICVLEPVRLRVHLA
jgi:hypothetical protein